ncbi:MAG: type II toxin-antitoxin system VapC family toxin [Dermatophilaceae bacterium]
MYVPDVNVVVNALSPRSEHHRRDRRWLEVLLAGPSDFGMSELVISGVLRLVTNSRVFTSPMRPAQALDLVDQIVNVPNCVRLRPGPRHLGIFVDLCRQVEARGNVVPDAYHAALAIETGCTWVTGDRGFARFPGLRWELPSELPDAPPAG